MEVATETDPEPTIETTVAETQTGSEQSIANEPEPVSTDAASDASSASTATTVVARTVRLPQVLLITVVKPVSSTHNQNR